jgi:hypothetical protein
MFTADLPVIKEIDIVGYIFEFSNKTASTLVWSDGELYTIDGAEYYGLLTENDVANIHLQYNKRPIIFFGDWYDYIINKQ